MEDSFLSSWTCKTMYTSSNQRTDRETGLRSDSPEKHSFLFLDDQLEPSGGSSKEVIDLAV